MKKMLLQDTYESPLGTLWLTGTRSRLAGLSFQEKPWSYTMEGGLHA